MYHETQRHGEEVKLKPKHLRAIESSLFYSLNIDLFFIFYFFEKRDILHFVEFLKRKIEKDATVSVSSVKTPTSCFTTSKDKNVILNFRKIYDI